MCEEGGSEGLRVHVRVYARCVGECDGEGVRAVMMRE